MKHKNMKRRNFLKTAGTLSIVSTTGIASTRLAATHAKTTENDITTTTNTAQTVENKEIYEWRIYTLTDDGKSLDAFIENTLFPAYHRKNIKTGAFKLYKRKEDEKAQRHFLFRVC